MLVQDSNLVRTDSTLIQFIEYVHSFYNKDGGIYPIATTEAIDNAIAHFIVKKKGIIHGDSFDREEVRCILEPDYQIFL